MIKFYVFFLKNNLLFYIDNDIQTIITTTELSNLDEELINSLKPKQKIKKPLLSYFIFSILFLVFMCFLSFNCSLLFFSYTL